MCVSVCVCVCSCVCILCMCVCMCMCVYIYIYIYIHIYTHTYMCRNQGFFFTIHVTIPDGWVWIWVSHMYDSDNITVYLLHRPTWVTTSPNAAQTLSPNLHTYVYNMYTRTHMHACTCTHIHALTHMHTGSQIRKGVIGGYFQSVPKCRANLILIDGTRFSHAGILATILENRYYKHIHTYIYAYYKSI